MESFTVRDIPLSPTGNHGKGPVDMGAIDIHHGAAFVDDTGRTFDGPARVSLWVWETARYVGQVETPGGDPVRIAGEYPVEVTR
jgi:hypothetical protein